MTRTVRFSELGGPEVLRVEEVDEPRPGPGEVVVDVRTYTLFAMTHDEERLRRAGAFIGAGLRSGAFAPRVDRVFDGLDRVVDAHRYLESNVQVGKIVLIPGRHA